MRHPTALGDMCMCMCMCMCMYMFVMCMCLWHARLTARLWSPLVTHCTGKIFVPSVAPGHDDRSVRPWNRLWRRERKDGAYYTTMWKAAIAAEADAVMINSFNGWSDGTQIESVSTVATHGQCVVHASPGLYLDATAQHVEAFGKAGKSANRDELR